MSLPNALMRDRLPRVSTHYEPGLLLKGDAGDPLDRSVRAVVTRGVVQHAHFAVDDPDFARREDIAAATQIDVTAPTNHQ